MGKIICFVVGRQSAIEKARGSALVGPMGETFCREYLDPAGLERSDVEVVVAVPTVMDDAPTPGQIARHAEALGEAVDPYRVIVALGKSARSALAQAGAREDLYLPHPGALRRMGDSGEVRRKLKKLQRLIAQASEAAQNPRRRDETGDSGARISDDGKSLILPGEEPIEIDNEGVIQPGASVEIGVRHDSMIEVFAKGTEKKPLTSRFLLLYRDGDRWAIEQPESDTPIADTETAGAYVTKLRIQKEQTLTWGAPGKAHRTIDVRTGRIVSDRLTTIAKIDAPRQLVTGAVLDPYMVDAQDDWTPPAEIEATAQDWLAESRTIGHSHVGKADATPVESYLFPYPSEEDRAAADKGEPHRAFEFQFGAETIHSGTWILTTKIHDEKVWAQIEKGEINAYSIGGTGVRVDAMLEEMPRVEFIRIGPAK